MGFLSKVGDFLFMPSALETKSGNFETVNLAQRSADDISRLVEQDMIGGPLAGKISGVAICARVIAEGLALPPCYVHQMGRNGKAQATAHPLYYLLNASPNERQTSYEFREMLGMHLALHGNAFVYVNRSVRTGEILELMPCDPGFVSLDVDQSKLGGPVNYYLLGQRMPAGSIWHLKGPSWLSWQGTNTLTEARNAVLLAGASDQFSLNLFRNGAKPGGYLAPPDGQSLTDEQGAALMASFQAANSGVNNAHKTMLLNYGVKYTPLGASAADSQTLEQRRFQLEEICRFFRVSPAKAFAQTGSQSYASVEQAHIQHDADTDQHWRERFVQSANKHLLTAADRKSGISIAIDDRAIRRGTTAQERMAYFSAGIAAGIFTQNEARMSEGYDPSPDPEADKLVRAANIMGMPRSPDGPQADAIPKKV